MLNQPPSYPIALRIDQKEMPARLWPCVPRIGESVEPAEGELYRVVDVVHGFSRPTQQITLVLEKAG
jgi:hypothetical protein